MEKEGVQGSSEMMGAWEQASWELVKPRVDGCFFRVGGRKVEFRGVVYGPFPTSEELSYLPAPVEWEVDLGKMREAGFNCLRVYHVPPRTFLDACARHGLWVWVGMPWTWHIDFFAEDWALKEGRRRWQREVRLLAGHEALAGWLVANEIPATLVRWMGWRAVRKELEEWIAVGRREDPEALFGYSNYPPTEWLQPRNADFVACNIYLEDREKFAAYLRRQQHIAAGKPLLVSEFGCDHQHHGRDRQLEMFSWFWDEVRAGGCGGGIWFTWSDNWRDPRGGMVRGWKFGLVTEDREMSPAVEKAAAIFAKVDVAWRLPERGPLISVVVCTRNGRERIGSCLESLLGQRYMDCEVIVVDDGSTDGTGEMVAGAYAGVRLVRLAPSGLGAARNAGAQAARGDYIAYMDDDCEADEDWLAWLMKGFVEGVGDALGGPNLPPVGGGGVRRVLDLAPSTAQPVMLDDSLAEHLPGCNLAVKREAFEAVGGFDAIYHSAGDDVDFCWKLAKQGYVIAYIPLALVWHARRQTLGAYLRQQAGYGRAEALLAGQWRDKVGPHGARWHGCVYGAGLGRSFRVYQGAFGYAGYVRILDKQAGPEEPWFQSVGYGWYWRVLRYLQPWARAYGRWRGGMRPAGWPWTLGRDVQSEGEQPTGVCREWRLWSGRGRDRDEILAGLQEEMARDEWRVVADDGWHCWDLRVEKAGVAWVTTVTEYDEKPGRLTRVRVQSADPECLRVIGGEIEKWKARWEAERVNDGG